MGGTISGLTGAGFTLSLVASDGVTGTQSTQTLVVPAGATSFTFPTGYSVPASGTNYTLYSVSVTAQPADGTQTQNQTCVAVNAYGAIHASADVTSIQVTCAANTSSPLNGVYQLVSGGLPQKLWMAFSTDGTYMLGLANNDTTCANNGNGVDYGSYNWNSATGALDFQSLAVDSVSPCGLVGSTGAGNFTLVRTGGGSGAVLQMTNLTNGNRLTLVPVASSASSVVGAFTFGQGLDQGFLVFGNDGHYFVANAQSDTFLQSTAGVEYGCYSTNGSTLTADTTSACSGAVYTAGQGGINGAATTSTLSTSLPSANALNYSFAGYANYVVSGTRFLPTSDTGCCSQVTSGVTIGGSISGLTAGSTPVVLKLLTLAADGTSAVQSIAVAPGASTFAFPNAIAVPATSSSQSYQTYYEVTVAGEPSGPTDTCVPTNAYGWIAAAGNVTTVNIRCAANTGSSLQGVYQFYSDQAGTQPLQAWLALTQDGKYIFGTIGNDATCLENGDGVDYGAYNWNPTTHALVFQSAAVYSMAPCGFTNGSGVIDPTVTRTLTLLGATPSAGLTLQTTGGSLGTVYLLPVATVPGSIVGAYGQSGGIDQGVIAFLPVASGQSLGNYIVLNPQTDPSGTGSGSVAGLEYGCYSAAGGQLTIDDSTADCPGAILTAGSGGLSGGYTASAFSVAYSGSSGNPLTINFSPYNFTYSALLSN